MTERLYTREQAAIIGRRDICENDGHDIEQNLVRQADGRLAVNILKCTRCDVVLTATYPELAKCAGPGTESCTSFTAKCLLDGCQKR